MCYECTGGQNKCFGTAKGIKWEADGPFQGIKGRSGWLVDSLYGNGGTGGNPFSSTCAADMRLSGVYGGMGDNLDRIGGYCSKQPTPATTPTMDLIKEVVVIDPVLLVTEPEEPILILDKGPMIVTTTTGGGLQYKPPPTHDRNHNQRNRFC